MQLVADMLKLPSKGLLRLGVRAFNAVDIDDPRERQQISALNAIDQGVGFGDNEHAAQAAEEDKKEEQSLREQRGQAQIQSKHSSDLDNPYGFDGNAYN